MQEFTTPVGRIVWGHPMKSQQKKDQKGTILLKKDNVTPRIAWAFGVAYSRAEFEQYILPWLQREASLVYPQGVPRDFAWKYLDGDRDMDAKNVPYNQREGYAGCYVLSFSTEAYCPPVVKFENGVYRQMEAHELKCGDYVAVKAKVEFNKSTQSPGIYVNPEGIDHVGYGQEIVTNTFDPTTAFGGRQYQLPPGATAAPQQQQAPMQPSYNAPAPQPQYQQPAPAAYSAAPAAPAGYPSQPQYQQPASLPAPAHDFVQNVGAPQQPPVQQYQQPAPAAYPPQQQQYAAPAQAAPQQGFTNPVAPVAAGSYPHPTNSAPVYAGQPVMQSPSNVPQGYPTGQR